MGHYDSNILDKCDNMACRVEFEGNLIEVRNRANGVVLWINGNKVAESGGIFRSEVYGNLPDGRLVVVKASSGWIGVHYTIIVDNKVIYSK